MLKVGFVTCLLPEGIQVCGIDQNMEFYPHTGPTEAQVLHQFIAALIPFQVTIKQYGVAPASLVANAGHGLSGQVGITRADVGMIWYVPFLIDICAAPYTNDPIP